MTKLVICTRKLLIRNPHGHALLLSQHAVVDVRFQLVTEAVSRGAESTNPELLFHAIANTVDGVFETAVTMWVGLHVPLDVMF